MSLIVLLDGVYLLICAWTLWAAARGLASQVELSDVPLIEREGWPRLSVVVPACDEAETVESALRATLAADYPALQLIAVNDRSGDETGAIIDRLAATDARVEAVHIAELPEGWLGKLNALQKGVERAGGEWLLFADADAHLAPGALKRAVQRCEAEQLDFLSVMPRIESAGFLGDTVFSLAQLMLYATVQPWKIRDPDAAEVAATGAFMLVRRAAFERTPGFEWLKLEVADDFGLCLLIKTHGGRCDLVGGRDAVRLQWYASLGEMARRMQKNFYAITGRFSPPRMVAQALVFIAFGLAPLLAFVPTEPAWVQVLPAVGLALGVVANLAVARRMGRPALPALFPFLGALATAALVLRSAWVGHRIGGITWRGVHYPASLLAPNQRLKL